MRKSLKHNLTRIALVEAIIKASECYQTGLCFCEYCAVLIDLSDTCGIDFSVNRRKALVYLKPALLGTKATDALSVLSIQHSFQTFAQSDIFAGFMELPEGAVESYEYYSAHRHEVDADDNLLKRQTAFILVSAALPDSYLDQFSNKRIANHIASVGKGWEQCCEGFSSINMPILDLPASITDNIEVGCFWTNHFNESGCLSPVAGYGLEFGLDRERLPSEDSVSLKDYVELWPSVPDYFAWWDRSNGYSTCGGFIVRSTGLLVSQQWDFGYRSDLYIDAFNQYMAPLLQTEPESIFDQIIVVYSRYRSDAYIASTDPRSWDPNTPADRVLLPLPDRYGIVGNWCETESDYVPKSLRLYDASPFTPRLRAASKYLNECLRIERLADQDSS